MWRAHSLFTDTLTFLTRTPPVPVFSSISSFQIPLKSKHVSVSLLSKHSFALRVRKSADAYNFRSSSVASANGKRRKMVLISHPLPEQAVHHLKAAIRQSRAIHDRVDPSTILRSSSSLCVSSLLFLSFYCSSLIDLCCIVSLSLLSRPIPSTFCRAPVRTYPFTS